MQEETQILSLEDKLFKFYGVFMIFANVLFTNLTGKWFTYSLMAVAVVLGARKFMRLKKQGITYINFYLVLGIVGIYVVFTNFLIS